MLIKKYCFLTITLNSLSDLYLQNYKSSTIRGALGLLLKKNFCKGDNKSSYSHYKHCSYCQIYETKNYDIAKPFYRKSIIKPYVFYTLDNKYRYLSKSEELNFHLIIFGSKANYYLSSIFHSLNQIQQIGAFKNKGYGKVRLKKITSEYLEFPQITLNDTLKVATLTPLIIKRNNQLLNTISLSDFAIACARKAHNMLLFHYDIDPKIDFDSLTKYRDVYPDYQEVRNFEIKKWSQKRLRKEKIEGIEGTFKFSLPNDDNFKKNFEKSLSIALITGVGSLTTHGFGRFEIKSEQNG
ncbi:MAG: CRISPR system precrRNA processing endoribonuclease RAMP protein Cas6 [Candidatus Anstonellales archaeon]